MRDFKTGATRSLDDGKPDYEGYLSPSALRRFGEYMTVHQQQEDGRLRSSDNWQKGIPQREYLKSLLRHTVDLWFNFRDPGGMNLKHTEDLLCAILFNAQGLLHEILLGRDVGEMGSQTPCP